MAISYTDNFNFPLVDDACQNWGAIWNGVMQDLDVEMKAAQTPIILMNGQVVVSMRLREVVLKHYDNDN